MRISWCRPLTIIIPFAMAACVSLVNPIAAGGGMLSSRDLPDPESLFELELQQYNARTLSQLIPSVEQPKTRKVFLAGVEATVEPSGAYYVFGSIRYKRAEDAVPEAKVSLRIYPPAASGSQKVFQDLVVTTSGDSKAYFLTALSPAVLYTWEADTAQPLRYKILKAEVVKGGSSLH